MHSRFTSTMLLRCYWKWRNTFWGHNCCHTHLGMPPLNITNTILFLTIFHLSSVPDTSNIKNYHLRVFDVCGCLVSVDVHLILQDIWFYSQWFYSKVRVSILSHMDLWGGCQTEGMPSYQDFNTCKKARRLKNYDLVYSLFLESLW